MTTNCALKPRGQRQNNLTITLLHERNDALCKVRAYRRDQEDDAMLEPGDELDAARSLAEIETHAGLIDQTEDRLKQIDDAFNRLERGLYGVCEDCYSDGIDREPQERLSARREQPEVREEAESEQLPSFARARAR